MDAPEAPDAPRAPKEAAPAAPDAPVAPDAPKAPDAPMAPKVAALKAPEAPDAPRAPKVAAVEAPDAPETPEAPEAPDAASEAEKSSAFCARVGEHVFGGFVSLGLALGGQSGLIAALLRRGEQPTTASQLAAEAGCKERFVAEWLGMMHCADVIDKQDAGYFVPRWKHAALSPQSLGGAAHMAMLAAPHAKLVECFSLNGPPGLSGADVAPWFGLWRGNRQQQAVSTLAAVIPQVPGLVQQLTSGVRVLDIGCSDGDCLRDLADRYAASAFTGCDIGEQLIAEATLKAGQRGNLSFRVEDAAALPAGWADSFQLVLMFEVLHDLPLASAALQEVRRVLRPGGRLMCLDLNIESGAVARELAVEHAFSLYFCLGTAMAVPGCEGLGTCAGKQRLARMVQEAGLEEVQCQDIPEAPAFVHISGRKAVAGETRLLS